MPCCPWPRRYDSVDSYISNDSLNRPEYNDNPLPVDEKVKKRLESAGIDPLLSTHLAHLFIRDPLVIFSEMVDQDDKESMDHFENIQSTNWQTMRFKPPPPGGQIGWRVEFRSMEVQVTDFENAAFSVFIVLLTRAILSFGLNFYIPISKVDDNMKRAHCRDAVQTQKYFFRKEVYRTRPRHRGSGATAAANAAAARARSQTPSRATSPGAGARSSSQRVASRGTEPTSQHERTASSVRSSRAPSPELGAVEDEYAEMTLDEIINGTREASSESDAAVEASGGNSNSNSGAGAGAGANGNDEGSGATRFPGLVGLVYTYLDSLNVDVETRYELGLYLDLVAARANGESREASRCSDDDVSKVRR